MKIGIYHNLPSGGAKRALREFMIRLGTRHDLHVISLSSANHEFADLRPIASSHQIVDFAPSPLLQSPFGRMNQVLRIVDLMRIRQSTKSVAREFDRMKLDVVFVHPCRFENSPSILSFIDSAASVFYCQEPLRLAYETMPYRPYEDKKNVWRKKLDRLDPLPGLYRRNQAKFDKRNILQADLILVNSRYMQDSVSSIYGVQPVINYLGVDADIFRPNGKPKQDYVLSVGSLTPLKGFDFLIKSLALLPVTVRPRLKIVCNFENHPEREYLTDLATRLHVDVTFHVNVSDRELVAYYNQAALTLYAPVREPFGFVPIESMACGVPVVAVGEGGIKETVVDGDVGLTTERDEGQFAAAVASLLGSPTEVKRMAENARSEILEHWTWERSAELVERLLGEAAGASK